MSSWTEAVYCPPVHHIEDTPGPSAAAAEEEEKEKEEEEDWQGPSRKRRREDELVTLIRRMRLETEAGEAGARDYSPHGQAVLSS